jgi:uncharacterized small protein (DUF1192 family)
MGAERSPPSRGQALPTQVGRTPRVATLRRSTRSASPWSIPMKVDDDDDRPKKKIVHEIGQDLALLSVKELQERIALLKEEIARLEAAIAGKQTSRTVADQFFKK